VRLSESASTRWCAHVDAARKLHADGFQLLTLLGTRYSKDQYLGAIASGEIDYLVWRPGPIKVRLCERAAVIRYQSQQDLVFQGRHVGLERYWHADTYVRRNTEWQVILSEAKGHPLPEPAEASKWCP
jgi:hypothetical protein